MREHLFGDTACVTYTKVYTKPGSQAAYSENVLHLLTRRNGIWRLQLSSPLPASRALKHFHFYSAQARVAKCVFS